MEYTYEIKKTFEGEVIKRTDLEGNEAWIPLDKANRDYQAYLAQLDQSETPEDTL
jgi:hypothetical protein